MASLWNALRSEVMGTVDEFRQKGAIGALRDAALDTRDMATGAGTWLWGNVKSLVGEDGQDTAVLIFDGVPPRGATAPLQFSDGRVVEATVMEVDGVSDPPRAQVKVEGIEEPLLVLVRTTNEVVHAENEPGLLGSIKQEWDQTVQDFRQKGAVGALKDATMDAVDLVGSTAGKAVDLIGNTADKAIDGARSLIDLDAPTEQTAGQQSQGQGSTQPPTQPQPGRVMQFVDSVKTEIKDTVQDFREKGAVATLKDAAKDAVDLVGNTASTAVSGAKTVAAPILEDFWATKPEETAEAVPEASPGPAAASSAPAEAAPAAAPATASAASAASAAAPAAPAVAAATAATAAASTAASPSPKGGYVATPPKDAEGDDGKARKSLVSMRRGMFEQKKDETKEEPKKEDEAQEEEVID